MATGIVMQFDNVAMRYGDGPEILHDVSFSIPAGSFRFIAGPSGAGKSTLLRLMSLAAPPSHGTISLFGRDIASTPRRALPDLRRRIGVVFQDFRLIDHLSSIDNVALPLRIAGLRDVETMDHVEELLRWVGLEEEQMRCRPSQLSGGEQQRVAIARAVISQPRLLLADEPTGNVDDRIGWRLLRLFEELNKLGTTIVIATHSEAMLRRFPHPVLHLQDGQLVVPSRQQEAGHGHG